MNSDRIQQSLIDIEENLKQLDTARSQVLSTVDSSSKLSNEVLILVKSFNGLKDSLLVEHENLLSQLESQKTSFTENVSQLSGKLDGSVHSLVEKIRLNSERFSTNLEELSQYHKMSSEGLISQNQDVLNSIVNKHQAVSDVMDSVKEKLDAIDFYEQTTQIIQNQKEHKERLAQVSKELKLSKEAIDKAEREININIDEKFSTLKIDIEVMNGSLLQSQKKQSMILVVILCVIVVSTVLIYLKG